MIWPLQMSIKRKVVATSSVGFGVLRFIATKVLTDFQTHIEKGGSALGIPVTDSVGVISVIVILTMAEVGVALVAICLPTLRPGSLFHGGRWRWVSPVGSGAESRSGSSKEQCVPQSSNDRRQSCEESEADLDDDENQIDPRIGSRAQAEKSTKFRTGYEELILTSSGKVEVRPKEAV
ncbi:MAG: hypothetical protein M1820_002630 [Bogoriella megaspora]|nr:MAG: hypothetical protein M1820_002630 [Bogoriella megaspora]